MQVYLIRHGKTIGNIKKYYVGSSDVPVCDIGIEDLNKNITDSLYPEVNAVYQSPMLRCRMTSEILFPNIEAISCEGLRECSFGDFEGKTYDEIHKDTANEKYFVDGMLMEFPNGDNLDIFSERSAVALIDIIDEAILKNHERIAIIAHGGVFMGIMSKLSADGLKFWEYYANNGRGFVLDIDPDEWVKNKIISNYELL